LKQTFNSIAVVAMRHTLPFEVSSTNRTSTAGRYAPIIDEKTLARRKRLLSLLTVGLIVAGCVATSVIASSSASPAPRGDSSSSSSSNNSGSGSVVLSHFAYRDGAGRWQVEEIGASSLNHGAAAKAAFSDSSEHVSNFGELHVMTTADSTYSANDRAYAAGVLEGFLTHERISQTVVNLRCEVDCRGTVPDLILKFFADQDRWASKMVDDYAESDPFWYQVGLVRSQFSGLLEGTSLAASDENLEADIRLWDLQLINSLGDLFDIKPAIYMEQREDFSKSTPEEASLKLARSGHCTALFKVADDFSELYFGHSSWFHYSNMLRIYKHYDLDFSGAVSFSSYPGMLSSLDDFYLLHSREMAVTQTTNGACGSFTALSLSLSLSLSLILIYRVYFWS
jgi:hypothetical protein